MRTRPIPVSNPALMEYVNPYGIYTFPIQEMRDLVGFRPLRFALSSSTRSRREPQDSGSEFFAAG